jgi:hypothetical protein
MWSDSPLVLRNSWVAHPDSRAKGARFCFWQYNYFRWLEDLPPSLLWDQEWLTPPPLLTDWHLVGRGDSISFSLEFSGVDAPGVMAISLNHQRKGDCWSKTLRVLRCTPRKSSFFIRINELEGGTYNPQFFIFTADGHVHSHLVFPFLVL